jgi:hypothetical protein
MPAALLLPDNMVRPTLSTPISGGWSLAPQTLRLPQIVNYTQRSRFREAASCSPARKCSHILLKPGST